MDNTIISYLVKASVSIALFYGVYMLFLRTDTFLKLRRFFFLFAIVFSLMFPAFSIEIPVRNEATVQIPTYWLSGIDLNPAVTESETSPVSIWTIILAGISVISVIYAFLFTVQLLSIVKLRIGNESEKWPSYRIVKMKSKSASFSFFRWIFINPDTRCAHEQEEIVAHERVHVEQLHSIDTLLSELLCVIFWWNPFTWLMKKEIRINLEYLADQGVLQAGYNAKEYQYTLLQVSDKNNSRLPVINHFNASQLKKRISMMNRKDSPAIASFKYLLTIPIGIVLLLGNAVQASSELINISPTELLTENNETPADPQATQEETAAKTIAPERRTAPAKPVPADVLIVAEEEVDESKPFVTVEQMPQFPGGEREMQQFIIENLKYPLTAQNEGVQGRVTLRFIIERDGTITDVTVIRGIDSRCDAEAIRVIEIMPKWVAGKQNGNSVSVYFNLPIQFRLKA